MTTKYDRAFKRTKGNEGNGLNPYDPDDRGGMTYRGIARRYWPSWIGWIIIDQMLKTTGSMQPSEDLDREVKVFFKREYWDRCNCEDLPEEIALKIFDTAVNKGVTDACKWLQECLNVLNRNGKSYADIAEDGKLGPATLRTIQALKNMEGSHQLLLNAYHFRQGKHYWDEMRATPSQEKYARGWFARAMEGI